MFGLIGMAVLTLVPLAVPEGAAGFLQRGPVWPSGTFLFWTFVQAAGSLLGVGMMIRPTRSPMPGGCRCSNM